MKNSIKQNIQQVENRIIQACQRVGRDPQKIQIILAVKTVEAERILNAADLGYSVVGENRVQEARRKIKQMGEQSDKLEWHYIGHMQSNKVNKVIRFTSMVQSVDRMKIVRKMNRRLEKVGKTMDVLIQVNTSGEDSKYGIHPNDAIHFVREAAEFKRLNIKGLMTIGLFSDNWPKVRAGFARLRQLHDAIANQNIPDVQMQHLSMGMTNDFELAIEEGATIVRIGRAIFGERDTPDSYYWPGIDSPSYSPNRIPE
ncbi:YggS family pyridoxal phosphate-dependent enzyme [Fodinibius salsisoli]|uniref:Pyridoxal phosphate homeostasis protein n=1 Tax=Fodinibius salsisoli TaxID=2820877 RepID=A0ABT3PIJ4_9BACT|nr:YggS family pyridoxal phosphate-dependent enzyme [Fodinibius salsisoli]MCW9705734.1 YggS family pyridoxal phosphate-dependent enzyme [Fodinibius salsisoli]